MADSEDVVSPDDVFNMMAQSSAVYKIAVSEDKAGQLQYSEPVLVKTADDHDDTQYAPSPSTPTMPFSPSLPTDISSSQVADFALWVIAESAVKSVKSSDIRSVRLHKDAVLGKMLVDWIIQHAARLAQTTATTCSRTTALELSIRMLAKHWILPCEGQKAQFSDEGIFRYLFIALQDETYDVSIFNTILGLMQDEKTGITCRSEKVMFTTHNKTFRDNDITAWILKNVPGSDAKIAEKIVKVFVKRGLIDVLRGHALGGQGLYQFKPEK